jgi:hypothetical protein
MESIIKENKYAKIRVKEVMSLCNCSKSTAGRMIVHVFIAQGKKKPQYVSKQDFYRFYNILIN